MAGDLKVAVNDIAASMDSPGLELMMRIIADGESRPTALHQLQLRILEPSRAALTTVFVRAAERGELRSDIDTDWLAELIIGGIFMRTSEHPQLKPPRTADLAKLARLVSRLASTTINSRD
jgi:hypothetical protein